MYMYDVWEWDMVQHTAKWKHSLKDFGLSHMSLREDAVKAKLCSLSTFTSLSTI